MLFARLSHRLDPNFHGQEMQRLASTSWLTIALLAAVWILGWLAAAATALRLAVHDVSVAARGTSGGFAAFGFGMSVPGAILVVGPPLLLVALRLVAARFSAR